MHRNQLWMLSGVVAWLLLACHSEAPAVEESPPPAAAVGDEVTPDEAEMAESPPAPEPPPPAAAPPEPPKPVPPTVGAIVVHKVKDYDTWKAAFDARDGTRASAGVVGHGVSLDADKKNTVVVYLGSTDLAQLKTFLDSPDLKEAMTDSGVQGKPKITLIKHTDSRPAEGEVAATLMITHKVKDYATWRAAYDAHAEKRTEAGVIGDSVSQDPDDPNLIHVYLEGTDLEKLRAFTKAKDLKDAMKDAGVKGKPTFTFMTPQEMELYPPSAMKPASPAPPPAPEESPAPTPAAPPAAQ